jgi:hypothetical protein
MTDLTLSIGINTTFEETTNIDNDSMCVICRENLNTEQIYKLPECNHEFHTTCIISWFRRNHNTCPCCNNTGNDLNDDEYTGHIINSHVIQSEKTKILKQYAKRKDAPKILKQIVSKLQASELKYKLLNTEMKILKTKTGQYTDILKQVRQHRLKIWRCSTMIRSQKRLLTNVNILPFIIIKK